MLDQSQCNQVPRSQKYRTSCFRVLVAVAGNESFICGRFAGGVAALVQAARRTLPTWPTGWARRPPTWPRKNRKPQESTKAGKAASLSALAHLGSATGPPVWL